jgi:hypothetical protein
MIETLKRGRERQVLSIDICEQSTTNLILDVRDWKLSLRSGTRHFCHLYSTPLFNSILWLEKLGKEKK